jgi:exopolysaccharide production protein ExoQ
LLAGLVPREVMLLLLPAIAVLVVLTRSTDELERRRLPPALLLFTGWTLLSWAWSADRGGSVRAFVDLAAVLLIGLVVGGLLDLARTRRALTVTVKVLLVANVAALLLATDWATRPPEGDPVEGWHGLFAHKNGLGAFLALSVALLLCEAGRRSLLWLLVAGVLLVGSQSASSLGISLVLCAVVLWRSTLHGMTQAYLRAAARLLSAMLLAAGTALTLSAPELVAGTFGRTATFTGRTEIWEAVQRQIGLRPVLGHGWGGVWQESSQPTQEIWREARFEAFYAHNGYLDILLQLGVAGAVLFLLLWLRTAVLLARRHPDESLWGILVLVTLALQAITESAPFTGPVGLLLIAVLSTAAEQRPHHDQDAARPAGAAVQERERVLRVLASR